MDDARKDLMTKLLHLLHDELAPGTPVRIPLMALVAAMAALTRRDCEEEEDQLLDILVAILNDWEDFRQTADIWAWLAAVAPSSEIELLNLLHGRR